MTNPFLGNPFADLTEDLEDDPFADLTADLKPQRPRPEPVTATRPKPPTLPGMDRIGMPQAPAGGVNPFQPVRPTQTPGVGPRLQQMLPDVTAVAPKPSPVEQSMGRMVMQGTRKTDPFGAKDLTPEQQRQVARAQRARAMANVGGEFGVQAVGGVADAALNAVQGLGELADMALPGDPGIGDAIGRGREFVSERVVGQPETGVGMVGRGAGYLAGTLGSYLLPSTLAARAASTAGGASRALNFLANPIGRAGLTVGGNVNRAGQLASGAMLTAPVNVAMGLSPDNTAEGFVQLGQMMEGKEGRLAQAAQALGAAAEPFSKSPAGKIAFEFLADFAPNAAVLGVGGAFARTREGLTYVKAVQAARDGNIGETIKLTRQLQQMQEAGSVPLLTARGEQPPTDMPAIPRKPTQTQIDKADYDRRMTRALETGDDQRVTRLLERQQEVLQQRPLDVQLQEAIDAGDETEIQRLLDLKLQQDLAPAQGPQQWRGPQRFAANPEMMTVREELADVGRQAANALNAPGARATLARGAVGATVGATAPEDTRNKVAAGVGLGLLGAVGPRRFLQGLEGMQPGLSTQEVTPDFVSSLYSRVERQITNAPFAKGTGQQWAAQLAKNTAKGEREFTGIDTFLQENAGKVLTRDEVQQAFNANRVQLAETRYGYELPQLTEQDYTKVANAFEAFGDANPDASVDKMKAEAMRLLRNTPAGRQVPDDALEAAAVDMLYGRSNNLTGPRFFSETDKPTKFDAYSVPGERTNYREVMIQKPGDEVFRYTTHWDEPNVLTHVRMSDRTIYGKKTLFVEEVQDDWAQQARKPVGPKDPETGKRPVRGYRTPEQDAAFAAAKMEVDELSQQRRSMQDRGRALSQKADKVFDQITRAERAGDAELANMLEERLQRYNDDLARHRQQFVELNNRWNDASERLDEFTGRKAPLSGTRPFKQTPEWTELGLKRTLDEAVRGGYDQVALITGKQAADVYDLRKQVDRLEWRATMNADAGTLVGYKNGAQVLNEPMAADALDDYVGGELAGQLRLSAGEDDNLVGRVAGKDFEVGGKGMQKFYDEMLPNVIKDYSKKLGVPLTVRRGSGGPTLEALQSEYTQLKQARTQTNVREEVDAINQRMLQIRDVEFPKAEQSMDFDGNLVIDITPQVREKILTEGQPLWAMGGSEAAGAALGATQGETMEERLSNAALVAGTLGATGALRQRWGNVSRPFMPAEAMAIAKHGFVELPPGAVRNEALDRAHTATVESIFHTTAPAMRGGVVEEGTGVGLFFGDVSPNTIVRFVNDESALRNAAVRGLAMGQDAQLLIRAAKPNDVPMEPKGFTGTTAGVILTGPNEAALTRAEAEAVIDAAKEQGLGGATFDEKTGHVLFHNIKGYTEATDQEFVNQVFAAANGVSIPLNAQYGTFYVDYLNGPSAYFRALGNDADALRDAARALDALAPEYRAYAQQVGADPAAFEDRLAATRNLIEGRLDALSRSSGPLSQMQAEIAKVKKTTKEQAAALAEADTRSRLKGTRGPVDLSDATPAKRMLRAMKLGMEDMREAIQRFGRDASEWYSKQGRQASAQMQAMIPELRGSPEKRFIADVVLAITSSGATVEDNLARAVPIIRQWLDTGQITQLDAYRGMASGFDAAGRKVQGPAYALPRDPEAIRAAGMEGEEVINPKTGAVETKRIRSGIFREDLRGSTRLPSIETGLRKLQLFLDANGGDIDAVRKYFGKDWISDDGTMKRPMTAEVLGPKIGRFLLNVQGAGSEVTVDTWALRTWMRWMGYGENARLALDEEEGAKLLLREGPTPTEQPEIRKAFAKLASATSKDTGQDFEPADVQALLWYLEKYKYGKWGSPSDLVSFADVGDRFLVDGLPAIQKSNVAGQPYTFKFGGKSDTKGLGSAMVKGDLSRFGFEGKVYDLGGAVGEGVMDMMRTPSGRELLGKSALTGAGLAMRESEDERLRMTGNAAIGAVLGSLAYKGAIRPAGKALVAGMADGLRQSETGRQLLTALSRDFTTDPRVTEVVNTFRQQLAQGTAVGRELAGEARRLGPQGNRLVSDLVEGEAFEATAGMSPEDMAVATALANRIADAVQVMGQEKVGAGLLSPATLAKRERSYLRRMYAKFDAADAAEDVTVNAKGKTFRIEGERIRNDDLTPEERLAMGEIREADYRLAETFGRGYRDIASAKLFNALREMPGVLQPEYATAFGEAATAQAFHKQLLAERKAATTAAERSALEPLIRDARQAMLEAKGRVRDLQQRFKEAPPADMLGVIKRAGKDDYVRMPDTPSMGVLRGAVVRRDVADYLNDIPEMSSQSSAFGRLLTKWKVIHTVYNTGTQIGNFVSNVSNAHMGGIPWWMQGKEMFWDGAVKDIRNYGPATRALAEAGVLDRGLPLYGDLPSKGLYEDKLALRQLATTTRPETRAQIEAAGLTPMGKGEQLLRRGQAAVEKSYAMGDAIYRVMLMRKYLKDGLSQEDAVAKVLEYMPTYDTRSPLLKGLRGTVSPFIMYTAKTVPMLLDKIAQHPERWATLAATWAVVDQWSRRKYGAMEEEDLPPNQRMGKTGYFLPQRVQVDALMRPFMDIPANRNPTIDVARFTPLAALTGSPAPGSLATQLGEDVPGILQPGGPMVSLGAQLTNTDPYTGEKLIRPSDTAGDIAAKLGQQAASYLLPSFASFHIPRVIGDLRAGDPDKAAVDALGILGMRPTMVEPGMQALRDLRRFEDQRRDLTTQFRRDLRDTKDPERRRELQQRYRDKAQRFRQEYQERRGK